MGLVVTDTGEGMDQTTLQRMFEPFFTTKAPGAGTGLGLASTHGIVRQSGGHVWVYSEPGRGATFKIYFPRVYDEAESPEKVARSKAVSRGQEAVLVVDDDSAVLGVVASILRRAGYAVYTSSNGPDALRLLDALPGIVIVVTDVIMPHMGALEFAKTLSSSHPSTKILYMSGYAGDTIVRQGIPEGFAFVEKPFTAADLLGQVRTVIDAEA